MHPPANILYVIQGEMSILLTAMRRGPRWSSYASQDEGQDSLLKAFAELKTILGHTDAWDDIDPGTVFTPFLNVIRDNDTPGPVTGLALAAVNKLLSYHVIDPSLESAPAVMESIADAVTHARFVGTETSSDEVVLVKILQVLRTLLLVPAGCLLSNESVCEIMQSCFRLCFEPRLSELLRRSAEHILTDLTQLLFTRLAGMSEEEQTSSLSRLKMRSGPLDRSGRKKGKFPRLKYRRRQESRDTPRDTGKDDSSGPKKPDDIPLALAGAEAASACGGQRAPSGTASDSAALATTPSAPKGAVVDLHHLDRLRVSEGVGGGADPLQQAGAAGGAETYPQVVSPHAAAADSERVQTEQAFTQELPVGTEPDRDAPAPEPGDGAADEAIQVDGGVHESTSAVDESMSAVDGGAGESTLAVDESMSAVDGGVDECADGTIASSLASVESPVDETEDELRENPQGVKFTGRGRGSGPLLPYGLPCVREVLNFFASLINPLDRNNSDFMIHCGLGLLAVAMETGADHMARLPSLIALVQDDICRSLFSLLNSERLSIFSASLRVCLLTFEALRAHTKFQLEMYITRLTETVVSENPRTAYEQKEMALDALLQLWKIPGLVTELYLNYDCDPYCSNLFEDVTKLLSKNAFPVQGLYSTHLLSLDALLTVVDSIEHQCHTRIHSERRSQEQVVSDDAASPPADAAPSYDYAASGYTIGCGQQRAPPTGDVAGGHWSTRRLPVDQEVPTHEELMAVKHKKKLLASGTEHFNAKPAKGIQFLQDNGLLSTPLDPKEVVAFIKENPRLDKKMIGEYISNRKNLVVLDAFVKSFDFTALRVDESLRLYLETFRLPGEAPVISLLMEHFADHWHTSNGAPFANADAAFTLSYAVIMLNVDQHNHNVRRNATPMTRDDFKRNLKKVNGGADFGQDMLDDIYAAIKSDEIVMPAEQTGAVRENYLWKVLLRRGGSPDGRYVRAGSGLLEHDLFSLSWGPTVAALSFVFDRSTDDVIVQKAIGGFRKCAMIAAHYGMSDVYDNLVISLCKFTTLGNSAESPESLVVSFGANVKAQLAARTVFTLTHRHGDILRDGWRNLLDCLLQLYRCRLLSAEVTEAEDFLSPTGRVSLFREPAAVTQRPETSLLSSLYSYIALGTESHAAKQPSPEDVEHKARAQRVIRECHPEQLVTESKFLRMDSLHELVKALILASHGPDGPVQGSSFDEDSASFFLEILIKVVIQNRDRSAPLWQPVRNHIYSVVMSASASHHHRLMERGIVGLIRLVIRLVRREELTCQVLQSLRMLLLLRPACLRRVCRQAAAGLHELLRTAAVCVTAPADWAVLFSLLECVGAGARPPVVRAGHGGHETSAASDGEQAGSDATQDSSNASDKCYSDSELYQAKGEESGRDLQRAPFHSMSDLSGGLASDQPRPAGTGGWILVGREGEIEPLCVRPLPANQFNITHDRDLLFHDPVAFARAAESLTFLIRDAAHVTPANFQPCVQCLRTYVEASLRGRAGFSRPVAPSAAVGRRRRSRRREEGRQTAAATAGGGEYDADESDSESELPPGYHQIAIQLLDLMHTLHTRAAAVFGWFGGERRGDIGSLWEVAWCPLLQGIARLCCDPRKQVRAGAVTYLQRSLLVHDLQTLAPTEWEACFHKVLFPLLAKLLEPSSAAGLEETRMRSATLLCKVFLQHLTPLLSLPTFTALWLTILDFMDKYLHADGADLLHEAIPESMKNMLLVMETAGIFHTSDGFTELWAITWDRIDAFLPELRAEVFRNHPPNEIKGSAGDPRSPAPCPGLSVAPSMREVRPTSPLHHEELLAAAPSVILGPPLPAAPAALAVSPASVSAAPAALSASPPVSPAALSPDRPAVSLMAAVPPAAPVVLQPLPSVSAAPGSGSGPPPSVSAATGSGSGPPPAVSVSAAPGSGSGPPPSVSAAPGSGSGSGAALLPSVSAGHGSGPPPAVEVTPAEVATSAAAGRAALAVFRMEGGQGAADFLS